MVRPVLQTRISLDHAHRYVGGDDPYLWTVFFKIDGQTVSLDDDLNLQGSCMIFPTPGSHGNLANSLDAENNVLVPPVIGEVSLEMHPIPLTDGAHERLPATDDIAGIIGVVVVLMQQHLVSDAGAEAGHAALNVFVEATINGLITTLGLQKQDITPDEIKVFSDMISHEVASAISDAQGDWDNILSWLHPDVEVGQHVFTYTHDDLTNNYWDISPRFQHLGPAVSNEDWQLFGEAQGVEPTSRGYQHIARTAESGAPVATGGPAACFRSFDRVQDIVYRDRLGHVNDLWQDGNGLTGTSDLTNLGGAPLAAGDPNTYTDTTANLELVVYRGVDANVHSLYWSSGAVGHDNLTGSVGAPLTAGEPAGYFHSAANTHHVIYRSSDGHLHELAWSGPAAVAPYDLSAAAAQLAAGDPSPYVDTTRGVNIAVYRATDGHVRSLYWSTGSVGMDDLSGYAATPPAAGDPVAYYLAAGDLHQVTYRTADGHLYELWWVGEEPVSGWDLTAAASAPLATSDPAVYHSAGSNTKHVVYRGDFEHLFELSWVPGGGAPAVVDLTLSALAPRASGDRPAGFVVPGGRAPAVIDVTLSELAPRASEYRPPGLVVPSPDTQHVVYRGNDNQIHELRWT